MKGKDYFNWLNEEEQSKWVVNFNSLNKLERSIESFLEHDFGGWMGFIGTSFEFKKTPEGDSYWGEVYSKYKRYDNLKIKPGFNFFSKQPKVI